MSVRESETSRAEDPLNANEQDSLVVPAIKKSHLVWLFLMAELIVVRIVSGEFEQAEQSHERSER